MINCADWLDNNTTYIDDNSCVWKYDYPSYYNTKTGWRSAQAQGEAIQLLIRSYEITNNKQCLKTAEEALNAFNIPVSDGGLVDKKDTKSGWWYDKFADEKCNNPKVLNGMIFTLLALDDAHHRIGSERIKTLFDKEVDATIERLPEYDTGDWSSYDRVGNRSSKHYHDIHIKQLKLLYDITGEPIFKKFQEQFQSYNREDD